MHKAFKCKHCGKTDRHHGYFKQECIVNGKKTVPEQTFEADPEKFVVYPIASAPRTVTELMSNIGGRRIHL